MEDILKIYVSLVRFQNLATDTIYNILLIARNPKITMTIPQNVIFHENFKVKGAMTSTKKVVFGRIFKGKKLKGLGHLR